MDKDSPEEVGSLTPHPASNSPTRKGVLQATRLIDLDHLIWHGNKLKYRIDIARLDFRGLLWHGDHLT